MSDRIDLEADRRREPRRQTVADHGVVAVRIRPGIEARLLDLSANGAHVQTVRRLPPGCVVHVQLAFPTRLVSVRSRVLRCEVCHVHSDHVAYRCGVKFDHRLSWEVEPTGVRYAVVE